MKEEFSEFKRFLLALRKNGWLIIGGTVFCMAITLVISFLLPPVYESSLLVEVGEIYPPPQTNIKLEVTALEEPMSVVQVLKSREFLEGARRELGLNVSLKKMEERLTVEQVVELTRFQRSESPLVKVTYEDTSPPATVAVPASLARQLIEQHTVKYASSVAMLRDRIKNLEEKVAVEEKLIAAQGEYQNEIRKTTDLVQQGIVEYEKRLNGLNFAETERTEALFLKSTVNSMKEQIVTLQKEFNEANLTVGEAGEKVQDYREQIASLRNLIDLTKNSRVRAKPVLPEDPIRPRKLLNTLVAGGLALILMVFFVLFRDYIS